jgi:hypothetical protein
MMPKHLIAIPVAGLLIALGGLATQAPAATIINENFNDESYSGFTFSFQESGSVSTDATTPTTGVDGSRALKLTADSTAAEGSSFWGVGINISQDNPDLPQALATHSNIAYSFNARLSGFVEEVSGGFLDSTVNFFDGSDNILLRLRQNLSYDVNAGGYQTFASDFSGADVIEGSLTSLQDNISQVARAEVNVGSGGDDFGFDNDNVFEVDNVQLTVVPEPTSLAVLGLTTLILAPRRQRR